jgi:hypothetical protein
MNECRTLASVRGDDKDFGIILPCSVRVPLGVTGLEATLTRAEPDLQEASRLRAGGVELTVGDAAPGAHKLDLPWAEDAPIAHAVFMLQRSVEDVAEDFHVTVGMCREAYTRGDDVLIDHSQRAEAHVGRVIVVCKAEGMISI